MSNRSDVIKIIAETIGEKTLNINSVSTDFRKWDSLTNIRIVLKLEKKLNIKIKASDLQNMNSVKKIIKILKF